MDVCLRLELLFYYFMLECFREERNMSSRVCMTLSQCWQVISDRCSFSLSQNYYSHGAIAPEWEKRIVKLSWSLPLDCAARFVQARDNA